MVSLAGHRLCAVPYVAMTAVASLTADHAFLCTAAHRHAGRETTEYGRRRAINGTVFDQIYARNVLLEAMRLCDLQRCLKAGDDVEQFFVDRALA